MIKEIATAASLTKDFYQFLNFLKGIAGADIISSYHRFDGTKVDGSSKIIDEVFYLTVTPLSDYIC